LIGLAEFWKDFFVALSGAIWQNLGMSNPAVTLTGSAFRNYTSVV